MTEEQPCLSPERLALRALARGRPESLLVMSHAPTSYADAVTELPGSPVLTAPESPAGPGSLTGLGRFDAGLVIGLLGHIDHRPGRELVGLMRNLHCARLAVVLEPAAFARGWTREEMLALEFLPAASPDVSVGIEVFVYDIDLYNRERDWNNARHWANPENFAKFRW